MKDIDKKLRDAVRDVEDFPKPGILFKDISPILSDHTLLTYAVDALAETAEGNKIDKVVGIDARGFIFAAPVALKLNAGFTPIRKKGKLPWTTHSIAYSLEYGENEVEIHKDAIHPGERVLLIDDLLATGGTASAAVKLIEELNAELIATSFLIELTELNGRKLLGNAKVNSIISY